MKCWIGIDCGYSHMGVTVLDAMGAISAAESTMEPHGDGHDRELALARLGLLLDRLADFRAGPVRLAGYCYSHSGVREAFLDRGWRVEGVKALNDVVGVYGLTEMRGHAVVAACGSYSQAVYVDRNNDVRWAGGDAARALPECLLSGESYSRFLRESGFAGELPQDDFLPAGPRLEALTDLAEVRMFARRASEAARDTRDVFWRFSGETDAPALVLAGGAVAGAKFWPLVQAELRSLDVEARRVAGDQAAGLALYAVANPFADPWGFVGDERPDWLS